MTDTIKLNKSQVDYLSNCTTKSGRIRYLLSIGWSRSQVAKEVGVIYQFVRNVELSVVKNPVDKI